jgi:type VI secretion system secreted protein Hcp
MGSMKVFMKVEGIAGSSMEKGRKDWSDVRGFNHALQYPFDMRDNRGRGEPEHGACTVLKEIDKASPKLYEALAKKKKVDSLLLEFERDKPGEGSTEAYFRIELHDCRVISARPHVPTSMGKDENSPPHMEEIGFAYRKITWTWDSGGAIETTFDFGDPKA